MGEGEQVGAPGALTIGGDSRALGVARSLGRRDIPVWILNEGIYLIARTSRHCRRSLPWPEGEDDERAIDYLLDLAARHRLQGWTLFPTSDETAALVARNHSALAASYRLTTPPWEVLRWAYDKRLTYELAAQLGVDHPRTWYPMSRDELVTVECTFPAVLKPASKATFNRFTHDKAWRVEDRRALLARYEEARALVPPEQIMLQEFIPGGGETQFSFGALCTDAGPVGSVVARRTRQYPIDFGHSSSCVETVDEPRVEEKARRLLAAIGYTGLVEVEFKRDPRDGRDKVLDINPRLWTWHAIGGRAGVDFPHLAWELAQGRLPAEARARPGVRWIRVGTDLPAALMEMGQRRLSPGAYLRSFRRPRQFAVFALDDPLPALAAAPLLVSRVWARAPVLLRNRMAASRLVYAVRASRAIAANPAEGLERARERIAEGREEPVPPFLYGADPDWDRRLHDLVGAPWPCDTAAELDGLWAEMMLRLEGHGLAVGKGAYGGWDDGDFAFARAAWCLTRHLRPRQVVETGVARGLTTGVILEGLERTDAGRLTSIDLPPLIERHLGKQTALAVPESGRSRWTLIEGSSRRRLPRVLRELGEVDLFLHDSLHTERNMRFELEQAWEALRPGGVILADDVQRNTAFGSFIRGSGPLESIVCPHDDGKALFGIVQKPPSVRPPRRRTGRFVRRRPAPRSPQGA